MALAHDAASSQIGSIEWLLTNITKIVDLPCETHEFIDRQFAHVGEFMANRSDGPAWDVYPQGSVRLGTVVQPIACEGTLDVDMVCQRDVMKESTTQTKLMMEVGDALREYIADSTHADAPTQCEPKRRAWQLAYPIDFHMDVLPVIRDHEADSATAVLVTDKGLQRWLPSDPIAYADWFREQMAIEWFKNLEERAVKLSKSIEQVPEWEVKTTLQRVVQVLKAHRDFQFAGDLDDRPPSILITTLATYAYGGETDLFDATLKVASRMSDFIEVVDGRFVVCSPVSDENFADKWHEYPIRHHKFEKWLEDVQRQLEVAAEMSNMRAVVDQLSGGFGENLMIKAANMMGVETRELKDSRKLGVIGGAATLSTAAAATRPPKNNFYGSTE
jgi:hypothetical protein